MRDELACLIAGDEPPGIEDLMRRPAWQADALCREYPAVNFFPAKGERTAPARAVCERCLVRDECLAFAVEHDLAGVWGGTSETERRKRTRPSTEAA